MRRQRLGLVACAGATRRRAISVRAGVSTAAALRARVPQKNLHAKKKGKVCVWRRVRARACVWWHVPGSSTRAPFLDARMTWKKRRKSVSCTRLLATDDVRDSGGDDGADAGLLSIARARRRASLGAPVDVGHRSNGSR